MRAYWNGENPQQTEEKSKEFLFSCTKLRETQPEEYMCVVHCLHDLMRDIVYMSERLDIWMVKDVRV